MHWAGGAVVVIFGWQSEADAVGGAAGILSGRKDIEEPNEAELFWNIVSGHGGMFCEAEERDDFEDRNNEVAARRAGCDDGVVDKLQAFGTAERTGCEES